MTASEIALELNKEAERLQQEVIAMKSLAMILSGLVDDDIEGYKKRFTIAHLASAK